MTTPFKPRTWVAVPCVLTTLLGGCDLPIPASRDGRSSADRHHISDTQVTANVRTALKTNDALRGLDLQVATLNGDVRLRGQVDRPAQIDAVVTLVRHTPGAHTVYNELSVLQPSPATAP